MTPALRALAALARLEWRRRVRSPSAVALGLAVAIATAAAYLLPRAAAGTSGSGGALEAATFVAMLAAGLVAAGGAASHPEDRASGSAAWVAATGAPAFARRVAPAAAAALATLVVAGGCALVGAALAQATGLGVPTRVARPARVDGPARLVAADVGQRATMATIAADPVDTSGAGPSTVEVDVRPVFQRAADAAAGTTTLFVGSEDVERTVTVPVRGTVTLAMTSGPVRVRASDPRVDVVIRRARRLYEEQSPALNQLLVALLVGVAFACGAPLAALLSRGTSAPTAAIATAVLLVVGATRDGLLELASGADAVSGGALAAAILRGAAFLAPDLSALAAVGDAVAGRALALSQLAALGPALAHAAVTTLLLGFVPDRRGHA